MIQVLCVSMSVRLKPYLQLFGRFHLSLTGRILYAETPFMNTLLSLSCVALCASETLFTTLRKGSPVLDYPHPLCQDPSMNDQLSLSACTCR